MTSSILLILLSIQFLFTFADEMRPQIPLLLTSAGTYVSAIMLGGEAAPPNATLKAVTWAGSGCATGSNTTWALLDAGVLAWITPAFTAVVGGSAGLTEQRKFCQVNLDIVSPAGWQYGLQRLGVTGKVTLSEGLGGTVRTSAYFSGETGDKSWTKDFAGKYDQSFKEIFEVDDGAVWSSCGSEAMLNVKVEARFDSRDTSKAGSITVGNSTLEVKWQQCTK